jgi:hypothetical protein
MEPRADFRPEAPAAKAASVLIAALLMASSIALQLQTTKGC